MGNDPLFRHGKVRWYKAPEKGKTYLVGLDPRLGTGGDPKILKYLKYPMIQVGEWSQQNTTINKYVC